MARLDCTFPEPISLTFRNALLHKQEAIICGTGLYNYKNFAD